MQSVLLRSVQSHTPRCSGRSPLPHRRSTEQRWRPPGPLQPWTETRIATRAAPACPQPDYGWDKGDIDHGTSEDCLYLEVRTPDLKPRRQLPVMVWVHGGNATAGRSSWVSDGTIHRNGVLLVSVQYRLGALGWMVHPVIVG